jgi:hypothetical protein
MSDRKFIRNIDGKGPECPVCGHKGGCMISDDGWVVCLRVEKGAIRPIKSGMGWLHQLNGKAATKILSSLGIQRRQPPKLDYVTCAKMQRRFEQNMRECQKELDALSASLHLSSDSLRYFGIGRDLENERWTFPMFDCQQRVIGFRTRYADGRKTCVFGSNVGLFLRPSALNRRGVVYVPEGVTSAAAAMDCGYSSIGRPSAFGGWEMLPVLTALADKAVVCAENEGVKWRGPGQDDEPWWPGMEGALTCARYLADHRVNTWFLRMPHGIKDMRDWKIKDEPAARSSVNHAEKVTVEWLNAATDRLKRTRELFRRAGRGHFEKVLTSDMVTT